MGASSRILGPLLIAVSALILSVGSGAAEAPAGPSAAANLVANGGFETNGGAPWAGCGNVKIIDAQTSGRYSVGSGRYAVRLGNPTTSECSDLGYTNQTQLMAQPVTIPGGATALTLSFWYHVEGNEAAVLRAFLSTDPSEPELGAETDAIADPGNPGWQQFRRVFRPDEVRTVAGQTVWLGFDLRAELAANELQGYFIDDVTLVAAAVKTTPSPLPAALASDGTRPIAFVRETTGSLAEDQLYRMNTNGSKPKLVYPGELGEVQDPTWSHQGDLIAVIDRNMWPPGELDPAKNVSAAAIRIVDPDTGDTALAYQTAGRPGKVRPGLEEIHDFIQVVDKISWAPNDKGLAASVFAFFQYQSGRMEGGFARIETINPSTRKGTKILDFATGVDWSRRNRMLFEGYDLQGGNRADGVWELANGRERLLTGGASFLNDRVPTWSADGRRFAVIRATSAMRDIAGDEARIDVIMVFTRANLNAGRSILVADHGYIDDLAWSPDGRYILYTLTTPRGDNIWWVDTQTGATGRLTRDGRSSDAHWRPK